MKQSLAIMTVLAFHFAQAFSSTEGLSVEVKKLHEVLMADSCDLESEFAWGPESFKLNEDLEFILVPCLSGAYQTSSVGYLITGQKVISPVSILSYDESTKTLQTTFDLTNVSFDPATKTLATFAKGRGLGDCGNASSSVFQDFQFVTKEIRSKAACDGEFDLEWPVVFRQ